MEVIMKLTDTPNGGVSLHTTYTPAAGARCSNAQAVSLEMMLRTRTLWHVAPESIDTMSDESLAGIGASHG